jgi:threonine/homoserine/homoserine lactone efflux protein
LSDFLQGLGLGLILQISVGPVCIAVLHTGLSRGFGHAWAVAWGAALVDAAYILLSVLGVSALLQIEAARRVIGLLGALLLAYFGLRYLRAPPGLDHRPEQQGSWWKSFRFGVALTLTNPLTILFWTGVLGAAMSARSFTHAHGVFYFAAGCVTATLLFLTAVAITGHFLERLLNEKLALWLNRAVGLFLLGFALKLVLDLLA